MLVPRKCSSTQGNQRALNPVERRQLLLMMIFVIISLAASNMLTLKGNIGINKHLVQPAFQAMSPLNVLEGIRCTLDLHKSHRLRSSICTDHLPVPSGS